MSWVACDHIGVTPIAKAQRASAVERIRFVARFIIFMLVSLCSCVGPDGCSGLAVLLGRDVIFAKKFRASIGFSLPHGEVRERNQPRSGRKLYGPPWAAEYLSTMRRKASAAWERLAWRR